MTSETGPASGLVTFLYTDIEGSTRLAQQFSEIMPQLLERHNEILRVAMESNGGYVTEFTGDGFLSSFHNAEDAVKAAAAIQSCLAEEDWQGAEIRTRIGIHTGHAQWNGSRYMGYLTLARTARIMSAAYGEQALLSEDTYRLVADQTIRFVHGRNRSSSEISFKDLGERRLKDLIQPIRLYQIVADGIRSEFPLPRTLDTRPNNLPVQLTSFIGRQEEIAKLKSLLKEQRLLTLTGAGGAGKTRLALQIAADSIDDYGGGAWLVELASLIEPELLVQTLASALGIKEMTDLKSERALAESIGKKDLLIVFDNCEHMVDDVASLTEFLLGKCPNIKVLATSREALRCHGERTHRVLSLEYPDPNLKESPEILSRYESVRLFIERALAVNANFRVNNDNAPALAEICAQLDGIPLAIELAAARTKAMSVEQIHKRLDKRFTLLTGGKRTALPRQQTLKSLIDWSYDLLSENEKKLWNRLSIFSGGWKLESAEKICSDDIITEDEVIDLLTGLTEKSIVLYDENTERFRMLETIRQYGDEMLKNSNESESLKSKYLEYYIELVGFIDGKLKLRKSDISDWMKAMDSESGNLEKCLLLCSDGSRREELLKLACNMSYYREIKGQIHEGLRWLETAVREIPDNITHLLQRALFEIGNFCRLSGNYEKAKLLLKDSLASAKLMGDISHAAFALNRLGMIAYEEGDFEVSAEYYTESLGLFEESNDRSSHARVLNNLGNVRSNQARYSEAAEMYERALAVRRETGDVLGAAITLNNLGILAYERGNYQKAEELLSESLRIREEVGDKGGIGICNDNLGNVEYNRGNYERAEEHYNRSYEIALETSFDSGLAEALYNKAKNSLELGNISSAEDYLSQSIEIAGKLNSGSLIASQLCLAGRICFVKGDHREARKKYEESVSMFLKTGNMKDISLTIIKIAELLAHTESPGLSAILLGFTEREFVERKEVVFPGTDRTAIETTNALAGQLLGQDEFDRLFNSGKSLKMSDVVKLVLPEVS